MHKPGNLYNVGLSNGAGTFPTQRGQCIKKYFFTKMKSFLLVKRIYFPLLAKRQGGFWHRRPPPPVPGPLGLPFLAIRSGHVGPLTVTVVSLNSVYS